MSEWVRSRTTIMHHWKVGGMVQDQDKFYGPESQTADFCNPQKFAFGMFILFWAKSPEECKRQ